MGEDGSVPLAPASDIPFADLVACLNECYSDYLIPMHFTADALAARLQLTRVDLGKSLVALTTDAATGQRKPVAAVLLGFGDEERGAYVAAMGVVPDARRRGLASRLLDAAKETSPGRLSLECIDTNERALAMYRANGLVERRRLDCFAGGVDAAALAAHAPTLAFSVAVEPRAAWRGDVLPALEGQMETAPSWQNDDEAVVVARDMDLRVARLDADGSVIGFLASSGNQIVQLGVGTAHRRCGVATALVSSLVASLGADAPIALRVINVDAGATAFAAFLSSRLGLCNNISQVEFEWRK